MRRGFVNGPTVPSDWRKRKKIGSLNIISRELFGKAKKSRLENISGMSLISISITKIDLISES